MKTTKYKPEIIALLQSLETVRPRFQAGER